MAEVETKMEVGRIGGLDYVRLYVANAKQAASFYTTRFGFRIVAYAGLETGSRDYCSYLVQVN
jgi:4-hydroxyphenylpyruvate dioxygenase